jgi:hypothetical protein
VIELKLYKSYQLTEDIFEQYNKGKKLGSQLRAPHFEGIKALIRILKKEMGKYQLVGIEAVTDRLLRPLKTNRKQLAKWLRCGEKSVYNYLERLQVAGCINKTWRGSNASFDIDVNTDLIWLQETNRHDAENVAVLLKNPLPHMRQTLPHTLSPSVTCPFTNEYNELGMPSPASAPVSAPASPGASPGASPSVGNHKQRVTEPGYHPSSQAPAVSKPVPTPPKSSAKKVPGKKAPRTFEDALDLVPSNLHGQFRARIDAVWNYAQEHFEEWYPGYIVPSEVDRGRAALAEFFIYSNPRSWNAAAAQFLKRIDMVDRSLALRQSKGKKAWLPIPSIYFNHRNKTGFAGTKEWYKVNLQKMKEATEGKLITRCLTAHWKAVQSGDQELQARVINEIKQKLEKKGGAKLYARFTGKIFTQATINLAANS